MVHNNPATMLQQNWLYKPIRDFSFLDSESPLLPNRRLSTTKLQYLANHTKNLLSWPPF
jgi:hypothetical protein